MSKVNILGVLIDDVTMEEAVEKVREFLQDGRKYQIVTPNPEHIMLAQEDSEFRKILNEVDLAIPDGVGVVWASKSLRERVTGTDLMLKVCELAAQEGYSVSFLGGQNGVVFDAAKVLQQKFPGLKIVWLVEDIPPSTLYFPPSDLLFVAFGAPHQEKWIHQNLPHLPVKVAMGVGGAFDFVSGKIKRAPVFVQRSGLEWLWRLILQPWRIRRQLALFKFVRLVWREG